MTYEKAKEYFSAYSEGTLDAGLAQSFEAKLKADSKLQAEYEQFEATLKELESLQFEQIEVPFDLNDRISAAVDKSIYDKKRTAQPGWSGWLRNLAFTGLAASAVFGAYWSINNSQVSGRSSVAGPISVAPNSKAVEQMEYSRTDNGIGLEFNPVDKHAITVKGGATGEEKFETSNQVWLHELTNDQPGAASFEVTVEGEELTTFVVVPGKERNEIEGTQGSIVLLAKEIADKYGIPVVIKSKQVLFEAAWPTVTAGSDALKTAQDSLQNLTGVFADMREGILYIGDN